MPKPRTKRKTVLHSVVTFLIIVVALELGLHAIDFVASRVQQNPGRIPFRGFYQDQDWGPTLARESEKPHRDQIYHQYLTWISKPVQGRFVNIDRDTGRKTWNPQDLPQNAASIFFFGGSAAWGYGARDDCTIPSQLSRLLNAQKPHFRVYNYGEPAYTFTQGLWYLITRLREGARPDYVIFYDGFNDVYGAYQSGQAGALHNVAQMKEKLESNPRQIYWKAVQEWLQEHVYLYNKVFLKIYLHFHPEEKYREVGAKLNDQELKALAAGLVQHYAQSLMLLDHLSRAYGFKYVCFWQPALFTEAKVMPKETRIDVRLGDKKFGKLYRFTNQYLDRQVLPHVHNMADTVSTRTRPCYLDLVHMTEEGYGMVAASMYENMKKEFPMALDGPSE
jgi:hypothetical protein